LAEQGGQEPDVDEVWYAALRPLCEEVRADLRSGYAIDVALFYLARWCQKKARLPDPSLESFALSDLRDAAERIAGNLADHGRLLESFLEGDRAAWTTIRDHVRQSAGSRVGVGSGEFVDDAMQKISEVLLTGTSPSEAVARLREGPRGRGNEYVFDSPFPNWTQTVVINLIKDEWRRSQRQASWHGARGVGLDRELVEQARAALPGLLRAICQLPTKQRRVIALSFCRRDLDEVVRKRVRKLAPELFAEDADVLVSSDADIAERMGSIPHRVAANRSAARRKLAPQHEHWELLLDILLPHRTTRPVQSDRDA
jgi:hypothetical protein